MIWAGYVNETFIELLKINKRIKLNSDITISWTIIILNGTSSSHAVSKFKCVFMNDNAPSHVSKFICKCLRVNVLQK